MEALDAFRQRLTYFVERGDEATAKPTDAVMFSDLDRARLAEMRDIWPQLPVETRRRLVAAMAELGEEQIEYNFSRALKAALRDGDAEVRTRAIEGLWEDDGEDFLAYLLEDALADTDRAVREAASRALARFSQLAVQDELSSRWRAPLYAALLALVRGNDSVEVRRRALEALAVYPNDPEVLTQIERAYADQDEHLRRSAVYAMGRSLDPRWLDTIVKEMENLSAAMRYEATKASGELADRRAVPRLIERLGDDDREVQLAAIGSLGQIGGASSMNVLKRLAVSKDDVVREAAEEALEEASFLTDPLGFDNRLGGGEERR